MPAGMYEMLRAEGIRVSHRTRHRARGGVSFHAQGEVREAGSFIGRKTPAVCAPRKHGQCIFLGESGCSIHPVKPAQCRIFPFWPELVESRKEWHKTAAWCPGMGKGELVQIEIAREQAAEMRAAYPHMYK